MDLDAHLGDFDDELKLLDLDQAVRVNEGELHSPSNWKYTYITYAENYHLPVLHRDTLARVFAHNLNLFDTWGPHHRLTWPQQTIFEWMHKPESAWQIDALPITYFIFPNFNMAIGSILLTQRRLDLNSPRVSEVGGRNGHEDFDLRAHNGGNRRNIRLSSSRVSSSPYVLTRRKTIPSPAKPIRSLPCFQPGRISSLGGMRLVSRISTATFAGLRAISEAPGAACRATPSIRRGRGCNAP